VEHAHEITQGTTLDLISDHTVAVRSWNFPDLRATITQEYGKGKRKYTIDKKERKEI